MREIKFRAWDKEKKRMYAGVGIFPFPWNERTRNSSWSFSADGTTVNPYHEDFALMQYTGLKDKNGKEIYGGDVVEITSNMVLLLTGKPTGNITTTRYRVVYSSEDLIWYVIDNKGDKSRAKFYLEGGDVKIIGNIYENPELMGVTG